MYRLPLFTAEPLKNLIDEPTFAGLGPAVNFATAALTGATAASLITIWVGISRSTSATLTVMPTILRLNVPFLPVLS
ncbi:hypothetical protein R80B4_02484 [Fibrobacteres bacterium R8-0-B4]